MASPFNLRYLWSLTQFLLPVLLWSTASGQVAVEANRGYLTPEARRRAAISMDYAQRETRDKPAALVAAIGIRPGDVVADIGTGVGFMLPHLVRAVGPTGQVIAQDIYPDYLREVLRRAKANGWTNLSLLLGTESEPMLPAAKVDVVLVIDTYHHFNYPRAMLKGIRRGLKPAGKLVIVDYYRSRPHPVLNNRRLKEHIRADRDEFIREIEEEKFKLVSKFDHLPHEYVLIFVQADF